MRLSLHVVVILTFLAAPLAGAAHAHEHEAQPSGQHFGKACSPF